MSNLDYGCQKCPEDRSGGAFSDTYLLPGGYRARLCLEHSNAFLEYLEKQPDYADAPGGQSPPGV